MIVPILHAGGFSWDEAIVLVVAIVAVPVLSWFTGRFGKRSTASREARRAHKRTPEPSTDDSPEP